MSRSTDLLLGRRRDLQKEIESAIKDYTAEIEQIDKMLAAAGVEVRPRFPDIAAGLEGKSSEPKNVGEQVLAVLQDYPDGLTTREITEKVNLRFGRDIKPRNMSWHVSHLGADTKLTREGNLWLLPVDASGSANEPEEETNQAAE